MRAQSQLGELKIFVVPRGLEDDGVKCDATYDTDTHEIEIETSTNENLMKSKLVHELLHVCWSGVSGDLREKVLGGKTAEARGNREELMVSYLEPVLFDLMTRNGWLKFPRPPRFE